MLQGKKKKERTSKLSTARLEAQGAADASSGTDGSASWPNATGAATTHLQRAERQLEDDILLGFELLAQQLLAHVVDHAGSREQHVSVRKDMLETVS